MASPLTSSQFVKLLKANLKEVAEGVYNDLPSMKDVLYRKVDSDSAWEEFYSVGSLPDIPVWNGQMEYLDIAPGYHTQIEPREYGGGIAWERKFTDDKKYAVLENGVKDLMASAHRTQEKAAAKPLQYAFSSAFDFMKSEEGLSLCNNSHTTKSGTSTASGFDNLGTSAISKTALATARLAMRRFRNDRSERIEMSDDFALIVPDALADTANEIVGTAHGYEAADTSANKINVAYKRAEVIPYLRLDDVDASNWFLVNKTMMKRNLIWMDRIRPEINNTVDFETLQLKTSLYMRFACGWLDWRWVYGSQVS